MVPVVREVPVECVPAEGAAVLCRPVDPREGRRLLLGRIGFLAGLHWGGAISSSGSLSASHSLNVFGKTMNTALSVSYGPNGYYQVRCLYSQEFLIPSHCTRIYAFCFCFLCDEAKHFLRQGT